MTTLEMPRPRRPTASSVRRLSAAQPLTPASPTVIRTPDFILFPSVPTHEPEDNLPTPLAWQQQFAAVALNDAHARRSRNNSIQRSPSSEDWRLPGSSRSDFSHHSSSGGSNSHNTVLHEDNDELEEIADPENEVDGDPAASYDAVRDVRNQQLDSLQSVVHSIAEFHFDRASSSSSSGPDSDITETLDDMFASIRRIGGHNAPLSPTFARPMMASPNMHQLSDVDRLVLLVDRLKASVGGITDAHQAGLLAKLIKLTQGLIESERRIAHPAAAALESPPRTPRSVLATSRRRSFIHAVQHSPRSSSQLSLSRGSFSSTQSYNTLPTSSDEAGHNSDAELQHRRARSKSLSAAAAAASSPATKFTKPLDALAEVAPLSAVPEQHQFDGSVFDMATVRQSPKPPARDAPFSFETLYSPLSTALGLINTHSSPRSDQASLAASVAAKSDATALPGRSRRSRSVSVQTDDNKSVASTCLPGYNSHEAPGYEVADASSTSKNLEKQSQAGDLPQYAESTAAAASASLSSDVKKPVEAPTLLERRRAKMAAQHSAYAARTPEDLAVVQSSIDHMSTVMPQLDNQRALSPEEQREAQLQTMMGRLSKSSSTRMNDQRSNPPTLRATRTAPSPPLASTTAQTGLLTPLVAVNELPPRRESTFVPEREAPKTPTTPPFVSNASSSRRASLLPSAFTRKLSIASIGNALRRASIYDASKAKQQQQQQPPPKAVERRQQSESEVSAPTIVVDDATVRHRRGQASRDTRTKYDIAESLTTLINDGKAPNKSSPVSSIRSSRASKRESQGFRAIDFADDTPRGRDTVMARDGIEMEDEDDSMLQDYSFAKVTTTKSNHRLSIMPIVPDSPRSLADWGSSASSRRSSNHGSASPGTPTWPKSPLTPVSPTMPTAKRISMKPSVTFAAGTLPPPPAGQSVAANNSIRKYPDSSASDPVCAPAPTDTAAANDLIVYTVRIPPATAADTSVRSVSLALQSDPVEIEYFAEAQGALGCISVLLWSSSHMEVEWELEDHVTLHLWSNRNVKLAVACDASESSSSGGEQGQGHVRVRLPARAVVPQTGRVALKADGSVGRLKLVLTEEERKVGMEESRAEGMVEFPLSARELSEVQGLGCAVCARDGKREMLMKAEGVRWRALPSEGWEELVDAWMCHGDQELNRTLTETAVRFSSKIQATTDTGVDAGVGEETVWVGDTYLLVPQRLFDLSAVTLDDAQDGQTALRCTTCRSVLGERSSAPTAAVGAGTVIKLSKSLLEPTSSSTATTWIGVLLSTLQYAAASHGSRRFLITSSRGKIETWLFSRALFTTSLSAHWSFQDGRGVWRGSRLFFRPPREMDAGEEAIETVEVSDVVFGLLEEKLRESYESLPKELGNVLPDWKGAYLARLVE